MTTPQDAAPQAKTSLPWPRSLRALRHRNFQLFFLGQLISLTGTWMQSVAQAWLVYKMASRAGEHGAEDYAALLLGSVGFASQFPIFAFATLGGVVADHVNRHRIIVLTQSLSMGLAFTLAILTLSHTVQIWHIFLLACCVGMVNAFDIPARQAFIADMVGRDDIVNAIALNSTMFNGARMVGPAVAGILVATIGEGWCFLLNAVSYLAVIAGLLMMRVTPNISTLPGSVRRRIAEGFGYAWQTRPIRALLLLLGLISLMGMPYAVLMPIFASEVLHGGASALGILMGAAGVGALAGAVALTRREGLRGLGRWIAMAAAGFGLSLIAFSLSSSLWLSAALLVPVGFCMMVTMASSNTLIQSMVPDRLRGRVMAIYSMMFMGMAPFGALYAGTVAQAIGAPMTVALGGAACLLGAGLFSWHLPILRQEAREIILALQMAAGQPAEAVATAGISKIPK
jgi:MFS family permease